LIELVALAEPMAWRKAWLLSLVAIERFPRLFEGEGTNLFKSSAANTPKVTIKLSFRSRLSRHRSSFKIYLCGVRCRQALAHCLMSCLTTPHR
jgi:hypothetical protein